MNDRSKTNRTHKDEIDPCRKTVNAIFAPFLQFTIQKRSNDMKNKNIYDRN